MLYWNAIKIRHPRWLKVFYREKDTNLCKFVLHAPFFSLIFLQLFHNLFQIYFVSSLLGRREKLWILFFNNVNKEALGGDSQIWKRMKCICMLILQNATRIYLCRRNKNWKIKRKFELIKMKSNRFWNLTPSSSPFCLFQNIFGVLGPIIWVSGKWKLFELEHTRQWDIARRYGVKNREIHRDS